MDPFKNLKDPVADELNRQIELELTYKAMLHMLRQKRVIIVEGIDGSGKTTLIQGFMSWLDTLPGPVGMDIVTTHATPVNSARRELIINAIKADVQGQALMDVLVELHRDHAAEIQAHLDAGKYVICDRGPLSVTLNVKALLGIEQKALIDDQPAGIYKKIAYSATSSFDVLYSHYIFGDVQPAYFLIDIEGRDLEELERRHNTRQLEDGKDPTIDEWVMSNHRFVLRAQRDILDRHNGFRSNVQVLTMEGALRTNPEFPFFSFEERETRVSLMKDILREGKSLSDRTGVGRRKLVGQRIVQDLTDDEGNAVVPMPTTRRLGLEQIVNELLWIISGATNINHAEKPVNIWREWALQEDTVGKVEKLLDQHHLAAYFPGVVKQDLTAEQQQQVQSHRDFVMEQVKSIVHYHAGEIGPLYGARWRAVPNHVNQDSPLYPLYSHLYKQNLTIPAGVDEILQREYMSFVQQLQQSGEEVNIPVFEDCKLDIYATVIDQLNMVVQTLKSDPYSSRMVVDAWAAETIPLPNVAPDVNVLLGRTALTACHNSWQVVYDGERLNMIVNIRSSDVAIGLATNTAFYAILCHMLAREAGMVAGKLILNLGDAHLYENHLELARLEIARPQLSNPKLVLNPDVKSIFEYKLEDVSLVDYVAHPSIRYPIAV